MLFSDSPQQTIVQTTGEITTVHGMGHLGPLLISLTSGWGFILTLTPSLRELGRITIPRSCQQIDEEPLYFKVERSELQAATADGALEARLFHNGDIVDVSLYHVLPEGTTGSGFLYITNLPQDLNFNFI